MSCNVQCQLTSWQSYIWFKNGQKVYDKQIFYPKALHHEDQYSCGISGHEGTSPAVCEFMCLCYLGLIMNKQKLDGLKGKKKLLSGLSLKWRDQSVLSGLCISANNCTSKSRVLVFQTLQGLPPCHKKPLWKHPMVARWLWCVTAMLTLQLHTAGSRGTKRWTTTNKNSSCARPRRLTLGSIFAWLKTCWGNPPVASGQARHVRPWHFFKQLYYWNTSGLCGTKEGKMCLKDGVLNSPSPPKTVGSYVFLFYCIHCRCQYCWFKTICTQNKPSLQQNIETCFLTKLCSPLLPIKGWGRQGWH